MNKSTIIQGENPRVLTRLLDELMVTNDVMHISYNTAQVYPIYSVLVVYKPKVS